MAKILKKALSMPTMMTEYKYLHFINLARKNGVVSFRWDRIASDYISDFITDTGISQKEKEWFYRRGFATYKTSYYGLNKDNINDYISDFDFYNKANYVNNDFQEWYEHKLNTYYLLAPFKKSMPEHYFYLKNGKVLPINLPKNQTYTIDDLVKLLKGKKYLALKACVGGHGKGFYKLEYDSNGNFIVNNHPSDEAKLSNLLNNINDYIVTEFSRPCEQLENICGKTSTAVIRVVTVYTPPEGGLLTACMIRLGCKNSNIVSDYDGNINCGIDINDGHFFSPYQRFGDDEGIIRRNNLTTHPDTGKKIEGFVLPNFDELKKLVTDVSNYLSNAPYLVMDIIPTNNGFHILEINSHGQQRIIEPFYPFRKNKVNEKVIKCIDR